MKVIRKKKGYRIDLTDSDFSLLRSLVREGIGGVVELSSLDDLTPAAKAAWTRRTETQGAGDFLRIDEDRRK